MSIEDIKRALVEVKEICDKSNCYACTFGVDGKCRLNNRPIAWAVYGWEDEQG